MCYDITNSFTRNGALSFLKDLLLIPHRAMINKEFANLFLRQEGNFFFLIKSKEEIISIFAKNQLARLNNSYRIAKENGDLNKAKEIAQKIMSISICAINNNEQKNYTFVGSF